MAVERRHDAIESLVAPRKTVQVLLPYFAVLATLYTLYLARAILIPIVIAAFLALFGNALVKCLERIKVPRPVGSVAVLALVMLVVLSLVLLFISPAQQWIKKFPEIASNMSTSLTVASESLGLDENTNGGSLAEENSTEEASEQIRHTTFLLLFKSLASATPTFIVQILATIFLIYFFLVYGHILFLRLIQLRTSFKDKRQAVELVHAMQEELSGYIATITMVNVGLGFSVGLVFYLMGVEDAFLWGILAGTLNFAPYIGPLLSAVAFMLVAYVQYGDLNHVILLPLVYLGINLIESQFVTPTLLGRNLDLNPLVVFIWLILWGWIWGAFGMLVGVPLLVCLSIYLRTTGLVGEWHTLIKQKIGPVNSDQTT